MAEDNSFWKHKTLRQMSKSEWESLCDGCGRCCLIKFEDEDTGDIAFSDVGCRLLDTKTCQCSDYPNRRTLVPDCVKLTPGRVADLHWLPETCAYRILDEGGDLPWWHPLVSGDPATVVTSGVSMAGKIVSENTVDPDTVLDRLIRLKRPTRSGKKS